MRLVHRCRSCHERRDPARLDRPVHVRWAQPCEDCGAPTTCAYKRQEAS